MDKFSPFQTFIFEKFNFAPTHYKEFCNGKLLSTGLTNLILVAKQEKNAILIQLLNNNLEEKIVSQFEFDTLITLEDRMQLTIFPQYTNVEDMVFTFLKHMIPYTRARKYFSSTEPIVGHIFTVDGNIVQINFKTTKPERLIEFY